MKVIAVVGATATGKSALSLALAHALDAEVINADSMQLYRGMDIGTAKLPEAEREGVPHHLLDIWDITHAASVAEYQQRARAQIDSQSKPALLVGGSGLYIRGVLDDLEFPGTDPAIRSRLEDELAERGEGHLRARLQELDPLAAMAIATGNGRRIVRALEVIELTGQPFSATLPSYDKLYYPDTVQIGLELPYEELDKRIDRRVERMLQAGLLEEVRTLADQGLRDGITSSRALGYRELLEHLDGLHPLPQAAMLVALNTRRFARRQQKWFRRDPRITWIDATQPLENQLEQALAATTLKS